MVRRALRSYLKYFLGSRLNDREVEGAISEAAVALFVLRNPRHVTAFGITWKLELLYFTHNEMEVQRCLHLNCQMTLKEWTQVLV